MPTTSVSSIVAHTAGVLAFVVAILASPAWSQEASFAAQAQHQHPAAPDQPAIPEEAQMARDGSGTSWLPDATPMYAVHRQRGVWQYMVHGNAFVQFLRESGERGDDQFGSINWIMGMAERQAGNGRVTFRGMFSAEASTEMERIKTRRRWIALRRIRARKPNGGVWKASERWIRCIPDLAARCDDDARRARRSGGGDGPLASADSTGS